MSIRLLCNLFLIFFIVSCSSNEEPTYENTSISNDSVSENDQPLIENNDIAAQKQSFLIEESDAEKEIQDDSQPIILAQANEFEEIKNWEFQESEHFMRLVPTQPTIGGPDKIEVAEFFYYGCIHCMTFEPIINKWKKDMPENVRFVRVPALWNNILRLHGRLYYTKEILTQNGKLKDPGGFRARIFKEWHNKKNYMSSANAIQKIFSDFGVSEEDFKKTFESFQVAQKLIMADDLARRYGIAATPTIVVNGKYRTGAGEAGSYPKLIKVIDELIERETIR